MKAHRFVFLLSTLSAVACSSPSGGSSGGFKKTTPVSRPSGGGGESSSLTIFSARWRADWSGDGGGYMILTFTRDRLSMETHCNNIGRSLFNSVRAVVTDSTIEALETLHQVVTEGGQRCEAYFHPGHVSYTINAQDQLVVDNLVFQKQ